MLNKLSPHVEHKLKRLTTNKETVVITLMLLVTQPLQAAVESKLETASCDGIIGWAWNKTSPASRIQVDIYDVTTTKTSLLTTLTAQLLRTDLLAAGKGDGQYGFTFVPPVSLRDALTHKFSVRLKGTTTELTGSPIITALPCYGRLNDTGWQKCSTNTGNGFACPLTDYPRQDSEYGRDVLASKGQLLKIGQGTAGFDYTKVANDGTDLPATTALGATTKAWACTRDNLTGLLWEVKTADGGLRDVYNTYSWYNPNSTTNGGFAGYQDNGNCSGGIACDTDSYVKAVNANKLCGKTDWRMPTVEEMLSIFDYTRSPIAINPTYFPNTQSYWFFTSTVAPGLFIHNWWGVYTDGQVNSAFGVGYPYGGRVRLVRG